jgi:hypothetical protein
MEVATQRQKAVRVFQCFIGRREPELVRVKPG